MKYLCQNLLLSIEFGPKPHSETGDQIKVTLAEPNGFKVSLVYDCNQSMPTSRSYHLREAIVLAVRRLLSQAIDAGMIRLLSSGRPGVSASLSLDSLATPRFDLEAQREEALETEALDMKEGSNFWINLES